MRRLIGALFIVLALLSLSGCSFLTGMLTSVPNPPMCVVATYQLVPDGQPITEETRGQTVAIIQERLQAVGITPYSMGFSEPDGHTLTIRLPDLGAKADALRSLITQRGLVEFVEVPADFAGQVVEGQPLPADMHKSLIFSSDQISSARPGQDTMGQPAIDVDLKPEGARLFDQFAASHYGGANGGVKFAILIDGIVQAALGLNSNHFDGSAQIVGNFSQDEVDRLAAVIQSGTLPVPLDEVSYSNTDCAATP